MKKAILCCNECQGEVEIYKKSKKKLYFCKNCNKVIMHNPIPFLLGAQAIKTGYDIYKGIKGQKQEKTSMPSRQVFESKNKLKRSDLIIEEVLKDG